MISAVALLGLLACGLIVAAQVSSVLAVYDPFYIWHAAVTYCVSVEDLSVFVIGSKVLVNEAEEFFANIFCYGCVIRRVEPDNFSFSAWLFLRWSVERNVLMESAARQCFLISFFGIVELYFIARCC